MKRLIALSLLTGACAQGAAGTGAENPSSADADCDAAAARSLVGQARSDALGAEALRLTKAKKLRWIPEGSAVTMDYNPNRLNILLDGQGKVEKFTCG